MALIPGTRAPATRWGKTLGGAMSAAVLISVPFMALAMFGPFASPLLAADEPVVGVLPSLDAPVTPVVEARSPGKTYSVAVVEKEVSPGQEAEVTLDGFENTDVVVTQGPVLRRLPPGVGLNLLNPLGGPAFIRPNATGQQFFQFVRINRGRFKGRIRIVLYLVIVPGRPSPS